jgi:hypothetical protein
MLKLVLGGCDASRKLSDVSLACIAGYGWSYDVDELTAMLCDHQGVQGRHVCEEAFAASP